MAQPGASAPARLGRYELLARLATGGMGEIFLARLEGAAGFEKLCVVKRILPHLADDARFRQMLIAEAQIAAKMAHANICQVYELGETAGQLYIVMEYLEGVTMLPLMRRASKAGNALDLGCVAAVIQQATDALHYAHELKDRSGEPLGLIHRDVTPANIFVCDSGVAKVLDFGIAKARGASTKTEDGAVKGKYAYMAPEQLRGGGIDRRVDVFALGVVLYEMIALRRLFQRKTDYLTFRAVMEQPIPDIRRYRPDVPEPLAAVVMRALDRDPRQRFGTARQLGIAVLDAIGGRPWSQGELGDFVKANFAEELALRAEQVSAAIGRGAPNAQRMTMPLIAHDDTEETDDDAFPSVETDVDAPVLGPSPVTDPLVHMTPPPFAAAGETTGSAPELAPLRPVAPGAAPPVVVVRRNVLWPLLAVSGVLVAGGALFLVWKQMQQQVPQQPAVINVTETKSDPPVVAQPPQPTQTPELPAQAHPITQPHVPAKPHYTTYDQALASQQEPLSQCLRDHPEKMPTEAIVAAITIAGSGHAQSVQLKPDSVNVAPLGGCLRNVLMSTPFPTSAKVNTINVPLKPKTT
jgi:eukaryotic-like serine/threonine-protein kinase